MTNDPAILLVLGAAVVTLTVAMETLARRGVFPQWLCRKVLHLGAVGACAVAPLLLTELRALTLLVAGAAVLLLFLVGTGQLFREAQGRPSWGIALLPLPYLALLLLFPDGDQRSLIVLPMLILAVSDALAAVVGSLVNTPYFALTGDRNTIGGSLTLGGGVAAALLGVWVVLLQGPAWLAPLVVFFGTSSVLGKALRARSTSGDAKQGQPRDAAQVFANGGIYGLAAALLPMADAQLVMAASMSVATADTWASEIGIAVKGRTYDIVGFARVPVGLSGGVSLGGTLGAAAGALLLGVVGALLLPRSTPFAASAFAIPAFVATAGILAGVGVVGMALDSALGSVLQGKYRGPNGGLQDTPADGALLVRGAAWISNDAVNLASSVVIAGLTLWLLR
jgi:uncharacterized protein (TIGR00297 family)